MRSSKKLCALIVSILTVALALTYISYGSEISALTLSKLPFLSYLHKRSVSEGDLEIHFIDVGQGDSILLRSDEAVLLIDTGPDDSKYELEAYLRSYGIKRIDCLILTHPHADHIGGATQILSSFKVGSVIANIYDTDSYYQEALLESMAESKLEPISPSIDAEYSIGDISFRVFSPEIEYSDMNNNSIVVRIVWGSTSFLLTGDAEASAELDILDSFSASELQSSLLKLGHHGSYTSTDPRFLDAVSPEWVVISCGRENEYGHPHYITLERLEEYGISDDRILRTDTLGSILLVSDGEEISLCSSSVEIPAA